jgi:hypothetical protein
MAASGLEVSPDTLRFGDWPVGTQPDLNVYVRNAGSTDVHVGPITISGSQASSFWIDGTAFTLASQQERRLAVVFSVQGPGPARAAVTFASDSGFVTVALEGNGTGVVPPVETRVGPSDPDIASAFGRSVGIHGLNVIIGAARNPASTSGGAAYVFGVVDTGWEQKARLSAESPSLYDDFGTAVDIASGHAIVGDPVREDVGGAYIFTYQGGLLGGWELTDTLGPTMPNPYLGRFGAAVALDGDFAVVGAPNTIVGITKDVGVAYVFRAMASPGAGGWHLLDTLIASDATRNLRFGVSADLSNDHAIIGTLAWGAYIFQRGTMTAGTPWLQTGKLISSDYQESDYFGSPVAIDGDFALVAAPMHPVASMRGAVYVFKRGALSWSQVAKVTSPNPYANEQFGTSIALCGDLAIVAGYAGSNVYLFRRVTDTLWTHAGTFNTFPDEGGIVGIDAESRTAVIGHSWSAYQGYLSGTATIYSGLLPTNVVDRPRTVPVGVQLHAGYPNPFNPSTTIPFELASAAHVRLAVCDLLGRELAVLLEERKEAGSHELRFDASGLSSGVYLVRMQVGSLVQSRKLVLLR